MQTGRGATITWTSYNLPQSITNGTLSSTFSYKPDRGYWKQIANYASGSETTVYVGGLLEKVTSSGGTDYRHMIRAGSATIIVIRSTGTNNDTYYVTQDSLGSSTALTNGAGGIVVKESFAAYGARRNSAGWTGSVPGADMTGVANTTRRGYTGHTELDNLGLIHMNGRLYDPALGRFALADPNLDSGFGTQGLNRYAYVGNGPLTHVDPSGFFGRNSDRPHASQRDGGMSLDDLEIAQMYGSLRWGGVSNVGDSIIGTQGSATRIGSIQVGQFVNIGGRNVVVGSPAYNQYVNNILGQISQVVSENPSLSGMAASGLASKGYGREAAQYGPPSGTSSSSGGSYSYSASEADLPTVTVTAMRFYPVINPGWDLAGLDFVRGIMSSGAQFMTHIRPRHASNASYPKSPLNGRFSASILTLSTTPDQFDLELASLFNQYSPAYWGPTPAGIALEFALPGPVGLDFSNLPTNLWTVVLSPVGSGVFQVWTTYPGSPVPND